MPEPVIGLADEFLTAGQEMIQPQRFAAALNLKLPDLAHLAGVHPATVTEAPENVELQGFMREALRVMSASYQVTGDRGRTFYWFRNEPIPEFEHRTAEQLVAAGKSVAVIGYLTSIAAGSSG